MGFDFKRGFVRGTFALIASAFAVLGFPGCETPYSIQTHQSALKAGAETSHPVSNTGPVIAGTGTVPPPSACGTNCSSILTTEQFTISSGSKKKIDFLFVVDNSYSMSDNQDKLSKGFQKFASTFFKNRELDICTAITTSDRYLGPSVQYRVEDSKQTRTYYRDRLTACTQPPGAAAWSQTQFQANADLIVSDFVTKALVGTAGDGLEFLGKSVVTFLNGMNQWGDAVDPARRSTFFRPDSVANISFISDENNWFYGDVAAVDDLNDIPAQAGAVIPQIQNGIDTRKGIKESLDEWFKGPAGDRALSYSVTAILETSLSSHQSLSVDSSGYGQPGLAQNLSDLVAAVGRDSVRGDIQGTADDYANLYAGVGSSLVNRASAFNLRFPIYEPGYPSQISQLRVSVTKPGGAVQVLSSGVQFDVLMPNGILLHSDYAATLNSGDVVSVTYGHL